MLRRSSLVFNRLAVERALTKASSLWKRQQAKDYPNGLVVFCSESVAEAFHPPQPLRRRVYRCGRSFDTSLLQQALQAQLGPTYGLVLIDGSEATLGRAQGVSSSKGAGASVEKLEHLASDIHGRTRRGGQSAVRFSRLRDEHELAFLRKVAGRVRQRLWEVDSLILAGKADMKQKLAAELPEPLRKKVICILNVDCCAGPEGLHQAAVRAAEVAQARERQDADDAVKSFLQKVVAETASDAVECCYGKDQTLRVLGMGAVDTLLVARNIEDDCASCAFKDWLEMAERHGTRCLEVSPCAPDSVNFCTNYRVGGCLRWPLDIESLDPLGEERPLAGGSCTHFPESRAGGEVDLSPMAATTEESSPNRAEPQVTKCDLDGILHWLTEALMHTLQDEAAALALTDCAAVLLSDEGTELEETAAQVVYLLLEEGVPSDVAQELKQRCNISASRQED